MSKFPSSLTRSQATGGDVLPRKKQVTEADIAMMSADQYKAFMKSRGEWPEPPEVDRDLNPDSRSKPTSLTRLPRYARMEEE